MAEAPLNQPFPITKMGLFANFSEEELGDLETYMTFRDYKKHIGLFSENTFPKGVYCLSKGKVKVYKLGDGGKQQIIYIAGAGEVLGFRAVFSEERYKLSAETLEDARIGFIAKDDFMHLIDTNKGLRNAVLRELSKELTDKALFITNLAQKTVRERLAYSLLLLEEIYQDEPINLSREDLANFVGTATETLIRLLKEFKQDGFIEVQTRKLRILNRAALQKLGGVH